MANLFDVAYHGTNINPDDILKQGYKFGKKSGNSLPFQWGGQKAYVTPSSKLASTYGKNLMPVITSAGARSFPGGSIGSKGLTLAKEIALTAPQFDRGAILAKKLQSGVYPNSATANAARTTMANATIKQSLIKRLLPSLMNIGSKMAKFPNPLMTILQGLAPKALGDGMTNEPNFTPFERPTNNWTNGVQTQASIDRGNRAVAAAGGSMDDFSGIPVPTPPPAYIPPVTSVSPSTPYSPPPRVHNPVVRGNPAPRGTGFEYKGGRPTGPMGYGL
tara:strand:- start:39 stop:863 length:825 start_codon:yes stop_codon:yes gene_type:complete